jgi:hypothetical protein
MTEEHMEGPISFWRYKEQESNLILPEHDDDDDEITREVCKEHLFALSLFRNLEEFKRSLKCYFIRTLLANVSMFSRVYSCHFAYVFSGLSAVDPF